MTASPTDSGGAALDVEPHCPDCGSEAYASEHRSLNALGYLADDHTYVCAGCGASNAHGIPRGDFDHDIVEDTVCDACGGRGLLYQLHEGVSGLALRFKCERCFYVWVIERELSDGALTVGYAAVMGDRDGAMPWGYETDADAE